MRSNFTIVAMFWASAVTTAAAVAGVAISGCDKTATVATGSGVEDWRAAYGEAQRELGELHASQAAAVERELELHARIKSAQMATAKMQVEKLELEEKFKEQEQRLNEIAEDVESTHKKHQEEMDALRKEYEDYQQKFRFSLREQAPGTEFPQLTYDGVTFVKPTILEASPAAVDIRHESGVARLDFAFLSDELRERFGYDPIDAADHMKTRSRKKSDTLVTVSSAKDREASYERQIALRIEYKSWEHKLAKADDAIRRKEARIRSLKEQLAKAKPGSFIINRLKNDIVLFTRDLKYLQRVRRDVAATEPANPDAE